MLLIGASLAVAQDSQTAPKSAAADPSSIPAEAVHQPNPVKPTPASIAEGKKYYGYDCAMCHGSNGDGKGEVAVDEKLTISDFRDPATLKGKTDGELFYILTKGKGHMPAEPIRPNANALWSMINYIRSFSSTKPQ
jgi:mono/diheme cytochrome c family protein